MDITVDGLPLHPLLVHAVVVLVPLTAVAVILHAVWPAARRRLGFVTPLAGLVLVVLVPITVEAGEDLERHVPDTALVERHAALGDTLLPWVIGLLVVGIAEWVWFRWGATRPGGAVRVIGIVLAVIAVLVGVGALVDVVLIGEAGARAVWHGVG